MGQSSNDGRQVTGVSRRGFMVSTLAVGFALAVRPLLAETITTDATGLTTGEVSIPTSDGNLPAFRAMPSQGRSFPVVRLAGNPSELQPKHPVDVAGSLTAPVLGLYGGSDQGIPLDTVEQMQASLKAANSPSHIVVYPDTPHAFFADYRPSYRKQQAEVGWNRLREWFTQHGVA